MIRGIPRSIKSATILALMIATILIVGPTLEASHAVIP